MRAAHEWLEKFTAVGGFILTDDNTRTIGQQILGRSDADISAARKMIVEITSDSKPTIH